MNNKKCKTADITEIRGTFSARSSDQRGPFLNKVRYHKPVCLNEQDPFDGISASHDVKTYKKKNEISQDAGTSMMCCL